MGQSDQSYVKPVGGFFWAWPSTALFHGTPRLSSLFAQRIGEKHVFFTFPMNICAPSSQSCKQQRICACPRNILGHAPSPAHLQLAFLGGSPGKGDSTLLGKGMQRSSKGFIDLPTHAPRRVRRAFLGSTRKGTAQRHTRHTRLRGETRQV